MAFEQFQNLDATARLHLLTKLILDATIDGRGAYLPMSDEIENGPALRCVNELVHRLVSLMDHLMDGRPNAEAYAEGIWNDQIQPWAERRPGRLEALIETVAAPAP